MIGILVAIAVLIFAFANGCRPDPGSGLYRPAYVASVQRVAPFGQEAVAGQDNSALKIQAPAGAAAVTLAVPKNGMELFQAVCSTCHGAGLAGAPKAGDKAAWAPRIAEGKATLYQHASTATTARPAPCRPRAGAPTCPTR